MASYIAYRFTIPFTRYAVFVEYPSVTRGSKLLDVLHEKSETFVWLGRFHAVISDEEAYKNDKAADSQAGPLYIIQSE